MRATPLLHAFLSLGLGLLCTAPALAMPHAPAASAPVVNCSAPRPPVGQVFQGVVLHVFDGSTICVAGGPTPADWVRVALKDGSSDRRALMAAAFAKPVSCVVLGAADEGVRAVCSLAGARLGDIVREPAVVREGAAWR